MGYNKGTRQNSAAGIEGGNPLSPVQVIAPPCTTALAVPHTQYNATWLIYQGALRQGRKVPGRDWPDHGKEVGTST